MADQALSIVKAEPLDEPAAAPASAPLSIVGFEPLTITAAEPAVRPAPIQVDRGFTSNVTVTGPAESSGPRIGAVPSPQPVAPVRLGSAKTGGGATALQGTMPVLDAPHAGIPQILRGARETAQALLSPPAGQPEPTLEDIDQQAQSGSVPMHLTDNAKAGLSDMIEGTFKTMEPLAVGAMISAPVISAIALGVSAVASKAAHAAVTAAGGSPESARLAANLAAAAAALKGTDLVVAKARATLSGVAADARAVNAMAAAHDAAYDLANPAPPTEPIPVGSGATDAAIAAKPQLEAVNDVLPPSPEPGAPPPPPPAMDTTAAVLDLVRAAPNSPEALTAIAGLRKAGWTDTMITAAVQQARPAPAVQMPVASARVAPDAPPPAAGSTPAPPAASDTPLTIAKVEPLVDEGGRTVGGYAGPERRSADQGLPADGVERRLLPADQVRADLLNPAIVKAAAEMKQRAADAKGTLTIDKAEPDDAETHSYSSTQVNLPPETARAITQLAATIPDADLAADGRETQPHVTVKYGLHTQDVAPVRAVLAHEPPITVTLGKTSFFPNGESGSGDVLKVDVDSPDLHRLNAKIADALPHTDTHPEYVPHATIAYLKPGKGKEYAGDTSLEGHTVTIDHVAFSSKDGTVVNIPLEGRAKTTERPRTDAEQMAAAQARLQTNAAEGIRERDEAEAAAANAPTGAAVGFSLGERAVLEGGRVGTIAGLDGENVHLTFNDGTETTVHASKIAGVLARNPAPAPKPVTPQLPPPGGGTGYVVPSFASTPGQRTGGKPATKPGPPGTETHKLERGIDTTALSPSQTWAIETLRQQQAFTERWGDTLRDTDDLALNSIRTAMQDLLPVASGATKDRFEQGIELIEDEFRRRDEIALPAPPLAAPAKKPGPPGTAKPVANARRSIAEIDRDMDAVGAELSQRVPDASTNEEFQAAWAAHPDLRARHRALQAERNGEPLPSAAGGRKVEAQTSHVEPDQPRPTDQSALDGAPAADGGRVAASGTPGSSGVRGAGADADGGGGSRGERPAVSGGVRSPEPGVGVPAGGDRPTDVEERPSERVGRAAQQVDPRLNYVITAADHLGEGGDAAKIDANLAAIKVLKQLQAEGRKATADEQRVLVQYVGWGAFAQRLFKSQFGQPSDKRGAELKTLLTEDEYAKARASTMNAHYTSPDVVKAMYGAVQRLGFRGGRVLEPAIGSGNFLGLMPPELTAQTKWSGTELDTITAGIAQQLYQSANILNSGLEKAKLPLAFFDLLISNVPFGPYPVHDPAFAKRPKALTAMIHNYFFAKGLDLVRPGGLVAFITSHGTLDAKNPIVREYLAKQAEFVGAIRLPKTAFEGNAGTEVVTDIIFLKKREQPLDTAPAADRWVHTGELTLKTEDGQSGTVPINQYFLDHPTMVVGSHSLSGSMYRENEYTVVAPSGNFTLQLMLRLMDLPEDIYTKAAAPKSTTPLTARQAVPAPDDVKRDAFTVRDGTLWQRQDDELVSIDADTPAATKKRIVGMIRIRQALFDTMRAMLEDRPLAEIKSAQKALTKAYDTFVDKHGYLSERGNIQAFDDDPDLPRLLALEDYDPIEKTAKKADIFTKRTLEPPKPITHVDEPDRAMLVALNETGRLDWDRIEQLTGQSVSALQEALAGLVYKSPTGEWQTADAYLSGDVKTKLEQAEAAARIDPAFAPNVEALKKVIPEDIPPSKISLRLGAGWIPSEVVQGFIGDLLHTRPTATRVTYVAPLAQWTIQGEAYVRGITANTETWGTPRATALEIIDDTMNLRAVTVYDTVKNADGSTTRTVNQDASQAAREKQQAIKDEFEKWLWAEPERRDRMMRIYNDSQNRTRRRTFDGSHLELPGMAIIDPNKPRNEQLRPHQKDGIWRSLQTPNMLAAHVVGAGKTYLIVGSAMEKRRQGLSRKPVVGVPNHLVTQWARAFADMYPTSNVLSVRKKDFEPANRKRFMAKIATGDWDAVIIPHSVLTRIPLRDETYQAFFDQQLAILEKYIEELTAAEGKKSKTVKQLEAMKKRLLVKMQKRADKAAERTDDVIFWEELGIDGLYIDEAHLFKNLWFPSKMTRISGLPNSESDRAFDMLLKVRHTQKLNNGGGVMFATGTPVSNTMAEMYTMQRYLQPEDLEARGLEHFDAWAQMFGDTRTTMEVSPEGSGFRMKTSFSRFTNMGRLSEMFRSFADVKTAKDLNLPIPKLKHGMARAHTVDASPALKAYVKHLTERAEQIRAGKVKDPRVDNMLKITSEGRKGALDMRLLDPAYGDDPTSKLNEAVGEIFKTWQEWKEHKGTQLVFSDLGTPKKISKTGEVVADDEDETEKDAQAQIRALNASKFDLYNDVKTKLVKLGIPPDEIAFIHDANTDLRKQTLFDNVNSGKVRILMGSTEKMGAGMNVQRLLVRLHQLDAPWRPSDVEQRTGRILRQGNHLAATVKGFAVEITNYITKGSFDAYIWQTLERKAAMIEQGLSGLEDGQDIEDVGGGALNAAEMKAASSGNPMVLEKVKAAAELRQLESLKRTAEDKRYRLESRLQSLPSSIKAARATAAGAEAFIAQTKKPDPFAIRLVDKIDGSKFTMFDDRAEASAHLAKLADEARSDALKFANAVNVPIGTYAGHDLYAVHAGVREKDWQGEIHTKRPTLTDKSEPLAVRTGPSTVKNPRELNGWIVSLDYAIFKHPPSVVADEMARIPGYEKQLADTQEEIKGTFPHTARIAELQAEIARIDKALDLDAKSQAADEPIIGDDDSEAEAEAAAPPKKASGGGTTLQSTILPGAAEFGEHILEPALKAVAEQVRANSDDIRRLFAPDTVSDHAVKGAGILRANLAARAQRTRRAQMTLRSVEKLMDGWSHDESMAFWDVMEGTRTPASLDPATRTIAELYRAMLDAKREQVLKRGLLRSYIENYWGHEWQRGAGGIQGAIRKLFSKRPLQGPESYRKRRSIPTMREGIEAFHLEPLSWNPTTQLLRKLLEMDKSISAYDIKIELRQRGEAKFVAVGKKAPDGWVRFPESFGVVYGPATFTTPSGEEGRIAFGKLVAGYYYGPAEVVRLLENHLSPGLMGRSAAYDLYRHAGNFLNMLQLSLSAFHFMMTGMESIVSKQALVFEQIVRGQWSAAGRTQTKVPIAPLLDVFRGHQALKAFYAHDANAAAIDDMVGQIVNAGGGFGWDLFEHAGAPEAFMQALRGAAGAVKAGDVGRASAETVRLGVRAIPAAVEALMKPIMDGWVPRLKMAAFLDLAAMEMATLGSEPDLDEARRVLGAAWDSIDNRFGQLRYDNLFWNNALKHLGMASVRALGWNIGTLREMFGVLPAQWRQLGVTAGAGGDGGGGRPPTRRVNTGADKDGNPQYEPVPESRLHRKTAWFLAMVIAYGLAGAIYMFLRTGQRPHSLKDYFFPKNGEKDRQGRDVRVSIPGYFKDLYAVIHALPGSAWETAKRKIQPLLSLLADILSNEDYFGTEIRNADDPYLQQVTDVMRFIVGEATPISVQQQSVEGFFGITKAPQSVTRSAMETYLHDLLPPAHRTKEQAEQGKARAALRDSVRAGQTPEQRQAAGIGKDLSPASIKQTVRTANRSGLDLAFQRASLKQAIHAYELATPDERLEVRELLVRKLGTSIAKVPPAERAAVMAKYRAAMQLPVAQKAS